jgi:serine/threonine-protein kinase
VVGNCPQCGREREPIFRFCPQCGFPIEQIDSVPADPLVGRVLGNAYVLLERVGSGGMGAVYRAEQRTLGRTVAVKVIHGHLLHDPSVSDRFFNEAHAASRLSHPNVVSVIDFGKTDDGLPYLVMEFLRGPDLRTVMQADGRMDIPKALEILRQILEALAEAHALQIVHRDLKPANVVLEATRLGGDFVKVVDFGLAKILQGSAERALATGGLVRGTPTYMAPEQAKGGIIDPRTDIYAVGVTLFELLTGRPPFDSTSPMELMLDHVHRAPPDPRDVAPDREISDALATMVLRALAKDPADRFQTAEDFLRALRASDTLLDEACAYPTIPVPGHAIPCPACGEPLTSSQKFCGGCGLQVAEDPPVLPTPPYVPTAQARAGRHSTQLHRRVEGGEDHLAWLHDIRLGHAEGVAAARIVGQHGTGKTTILREFAAMARSQGDAVALVYPDPWWAEPGCYGLRSTILQLLRLPARGKDPLGWAGAWPEAITGLRSIFLGVVEDSDASSDGFRRGVCAALQWALERGCQGALTGRVVVAIDDLDRMDGVSRHAFADVLEAPVRVPWLLVGTHVPHRDAGWRCDVPERVIQGIGVVGARQMLRAVGAGEEGLEGLTFVAPLWIEQRVRAGLEGHKVVGMGLADIVAHRMSSLVPSARTLLDAMGVLGDDVSLEDLNRVVGEMCDLNEGLAALAVSGFVDRGQHGMCWENPLFREVARGLTPAALRTVLHGRAADLIEVRDVPLEVRAWHALEAGRGLEALFLLESVARTARLRGDDAGAIRALRSGYDFSRRAHRTHGVDEPQHAALVFGRKLGEALFDVGHLAEAKSLFQEVLTLADDHSAVDVLRGLARIARAENRSGEAQAFLQEAITQARRTGKREVVDSLVQLERNWAS